MLRCRFLCEFDIWGTSVQINVLGPVSVTVGERTYEVRAGKVRALLTTLALEAGHAISHLELAEELWSGHPLGNPRNALQAHATRVRRLLDRPGRNGERETSVLRALSNGYLLDVPRDCVDGNRFLDLASQGATVLPTAPDRALRLLEAALGLWRGPALIDAGEGLRCRSAAVLFEERRLTAWEQLAGARLALGDEPQAVAELRRLVAQYPLREHFCELLLLALYRSGRQGDALELFRRTRQRFDEELGILPGARMQRLHAEILAQDPVLTHPAAVWRLRRERGHDGLLAV
ncbi:AfsR/SARP family transcriptional regulator [Streptomyces aurantiogriseus]|uniref:Transcriptional regulator RedD n=1 Tax=Streptomyces aurantiogriseus TaxID=66870 RepID=A0A918KXT0_9ACTN|nr:AfsR/SARP family transcriptional regulator [Streptomyces aurantiogriseus]GGR41874.1 transcriptional regulator RedD [Streptomyces aurantiogriseus]